MGTKIPELLKKLPKPAKLNKKKIIIAGVAVVAVVGICVGVGTHFKKKSAATNAEIKLSTVEKGNIEVLISGSGTVEPYERYEIISSVEGDILSAPFEIGDSVKKDDILFQIDSSDAEIDLQKQENSLKSSQISNEETKKDMEKLSITAPCDGVISDMSIKKGDEIKNNAEIATVTETNSLEVELPFNESQVQSISVGQSAQISSSAHMSTVYGTVSHVDSNPTPQSDGSMLYNVTVNFKNPGSFTAGTLVGGSIGSMVSPGSGAVKYRYREVVNSETEGTVTSILHTNGDYVKKGTTIATIENDSITNSVIKSNISYQDAQLSLENKKNSLEDYTITSPIDGTVLSKEYKAGDTIGKSNQSVSLMVVADVSKLKFTLEIDELDVSKVKAEQSVQITCDAVPEETFTGRITNVSLEGSASNGVTTYTADVVIDEPGSLRPSMNIDASVVVESANDVLMLPANDVKTIGNMSYVFVKEEDTSSGSKNKTDSGEEKVKADMPEGERADGGRPEGMPENGTGKQNRGKNGENAEQDAKAQKGAGRLPEAPDGFVTQLVTTGIASDDYIEIKSGLNEGDRVYTQSVAVTSNNQMPGMPGGGMPGGGGMNRGGGGMPGGGGGMNRGGGGGGPRG